MIGFAYPILMILLPLPWLVYRYAKPLLPTEDAALKAPFLHHIKVDSVYPSASNRGFPWLWFLWWSLLVLAIMKPQWIGEPMPISQDARDIMIALDISASMQQEDMVYQGQRVSRLHLVKALADEFITKRQGDRLGLILFASKAYVQTPLSFDIKTLRYMLKDATIGLAGTQTAIGDAIGLAIKRMSQGQSKEKVMVLLTDGVHNAGEVTPLTAAKLAKRYGIKIYTIGLGADEMVVSSLFGSQVVNPSEDLDEETLKKIAAMTGGEFFRSRDAKSLAKVYQTIDKLEKHEHQAGFYQPKQDLYHWPLGLALIITLVLASLTLRRESS